MSDGKGKAIEIKEAIEILKNIEHNIGYNKIFQETYIDKIGKLAIETVLRALENSISKDKIIEKIEELKVLKNKEKMVLEMVKICGQIDILEEL